ncbi:MAG: 5'-nucleotidase C-terminal domain-containing protein [Elusimicrobiaceae bacterium]|nr:5'-nucleotidase C-terminal domain-containing protein [Elusimicrobiaceae bacterium]
MYRKLITLLAVFVTATCLWAKDIVVYHSTDMHGHYFSRKDNAGKEFGGFSRLATVLKNTQEPFLLLDSGDFSSGSYEANLSGGKYSTELMNRMGYTALTIGNHDSDFGDKGLGDMLADFHGDVLAMNVSNLHIPGKEVKPHAVYTVDGIRVGVIGVAMDGSGVERMRLVNAPSTEDFEVQLQAVKRAGADVIIVLAHDSLLTDGISTDKRSNILDPLRVAPSFADIDLMLGGHAHKMRLVGKLAGEDGRGPWALEGGPYMGSVSKTVIHQDDQTGEITVAEPQFVALDGAEDPQVKEYLKSIRVTELDETLYAHVPTLITKYPSATQVDRAPAVARLMADEMYRSIRKTERIDLAAFSLNSTRSDYKPGDLTGRYFAEMAPYEEHAGTFDISGEHLLRAITQSIGYNKTDGKCFSGYGYSKNVRIKFVCNNGNPQLEKVTINGWKVRPGKIYRMAMLTHLPRGFYEGKPFQVMPSEAVDDGSVIRHYRGVTSSAMLFGVIDQFKKQQKKDVPDFVAPSDVQMEEVGDGRTSQERVTKEITGRLSI